MNWLKGKIKGNLEISQKEIAIKIYISQEHVGHFIDILWYRKNFAQWVPYVLMTGMKAQRLKICQQLLLCCENKDEAFFQIIVTADEMWMHHY